MCAKISLVIHVGEINSWKEGERKSTSKSQNFVSFSKYNFITSVQWDFAITKLSSSYIEFEVSWQVNSSVPSSISNLEVHIHRLGESHELVTFRKGDVQGISRIHRRANCGDLSERENFEAIVSYEELLEYPTHVHTRQDLIRQRNILAYREDEWAWERIELTGARDQMEQERNHMKQERDQMEQERNQMEQERNHMEQDRNELEQQHLRFKIVLILTLLVVLFFSILYHSLI